jgi:outer membrane protein TolC
LPQITLTGSYGAESNHTNTLFSGNSTMWAFGGQLMQPVFNGGALRAQRRSAIAAYQVAASQYQQTVLQAFQNVADSLQALQTDALSLSAQQQVESTAKDTLAMTQKQYRLGGVSYLNVLTAEAQYQQAKVNYIQAKATRYSDSAALFQSLGGGWWNQKDLEKVEPQS